MQHRVLRQRGPDRQGGPAFARPLTRRRQQPPVPSWRAERGYGLRLLDGNWLRSKPGRPQPSLWALPLSALAVQPKDAKELNDALSKLHTACNARPLGDRDDVGQAAANLSLQAEALGLSVHQMAGIDPEKARKLFDIPADYEAVAGIAIGYPGDPASLPDGLRERELAPRQRKPLDSFVFTGQWGKSLPLQKS